LAQPFLKFFGSRRATHHQSDPPPRPPWDWWTWHESTRSSADWFPSHIWAAQFATRSKRIDQVDNSIPVRALHRPSMVIRAFMLLAMMAFPMPLVAAPPDGADPNSPLGTWYRSLKVPDTGQNCCGVADCRPVDAAWIEGDRWRTRIGDRVIDIPPDRVLSRENPDGRGILCRSVWEVLCFVPLSGT
jgi:hypothetical protein